MGTHLVAALAVFFFVEMGYEPGWHKLVRISYLSPYFFAFWLWLCFPLVAVSVKRLHDLGRSGWWSLPMIVAPVLMLFAELPVWHRTENWTRAERWNDLAWSPPALWISLGVLALLLPAWWVIALGTRPGTAGPNRFGPAEYRAIGSAAPE